MDNDDIFPVAGDAADDFKRILGGDNLREGIPLAANESILVPIAGGQDIPVPGEILVFRDLHLDSLVRYITGLSLAPYADVRIQLLDKFDETVITIALVVPHPVLYVPVEKLKLLPLPAGKAGKGKKHKGKDNGQKLFHSANLMLSLEMVVFFSLTCPTKGK